MTKRQMAGFLVKFIDVGARKMNWEARIPRPVNEVAIVREVKRKKALRSRDIEAPYVDDYGGHIYAGVRSVGRYVIVPGSEL